MKFSNGCWLNKKGVEIFTPAQIYDLSYENDDKELKIYAPANKIYNRACTLGGVAFTIRISVPSPACFEIKLSHFEGSLCAKPEFEVNRDCCPLDVKKSEEGLTITSGSAKLMITDDICLHFYSEDRYLTSIKASDIRYIRSEGYGDAYISADDVNYMAAATNLSVDEHIYGLGEQFGPFVKNGQSIAIWNEDGGTSTEQSYKNVPFYMSDRGYGVFVNNTGRVEYEIASELVRKAGFSVEGERLDFIVVCGSNKCSNKEYIARHSSGENYNYMKDVLVKYTGLTGRPPLLPEWSFGLWLSTSFTTDYDEETVMSFIDGMLERGIPLSVFHFDCFWMRGMSWCNFIWDKQVFPDPEAMLARIKSRGIKVCVWINPYIAQNSELFAEGRDKGFFIKKENGDAWQWDMWQSGMAIVDFTNPDAKKWYQDKLRALLLMGVDCFKTDFGERIPVRGVRYHNGADPEHMHNYYSYIYNEAVYDVIKEVKGLNEAVLFARSGTAGGQKFPVHWGGDCTSDYESMAESLRGGLSLAMSGYGFWSHDIGGFEDTSTDDVYKRWVAFGLLSSHSRMHGSTSYRVPWNYGEEAVEVTRRFVDLKRELMPYIYQYAMEAHETGLPLMRSMVLQFPQDKMCAYADKQYMLGDDILVAPIFNAESRGEAYLPEGKWKYMFSDEIFDGGRWITLENVPYTEIPCFIMS